MIIIGNKPYSLLKMDTILDTFNENVRINFGFPRGNNGTKVHTQYLNVHVFDNVHKNVNQLAQKYSNANNAHMQEFITFYKNNKYASIIKQDLRKHQIYNKYLSSIGCPFTFRRLPRLGMSALLDMIMKTKDKIYVSHFSLNYEDNFKHLYMITTDKYNYVEACKHSHDINVECDILTWLHTKQLVDATLCALDDGDLPKLDCSKIKPTKEIMMLLLKQYGICLLNNYYTCATLVTFEQGFEDVFNKEFKHIEKHSIENCSNDERIFHSENYSQYIKLFSDEALFNECAREYKSRLNKKTLLNKLTYEEGKVKNSGAGWHRDNHECQFKALMYLTDVSERNGNFQFLTNSSKRFIGYPKPRQANYNTRYSDETISELLKDHTNMKLHNIIGKAGTVILADTTYIHRGNIIEEGERKAVTQYFF
jgi:hypothetical protein